MPSATNPTTPAPSSTADGHALLVLAHADDPCGSWAAAGLRARGLGPVQLVTAEALATARWEHRVGAAGAWVVATLPDGRVLDSRRVRATLNRLRAPSEAVVAQSRSADAAYAREELFAFWLSWVHALPGPLLNRPGPRGLGGAFRVPEEWQLLAARAGLPVAGDPIASHERLGPPRWPATVTLLVVAGTVLGPVADPDLRAGVAALSRLAATPVLGVQVGRTSVAGGGRAGPWCFAGATTHPDLRRGGDRALDALARALQHPGP